MQAAITTTQGGTFASGFSSGLFGSIAASGDGSVGAAAFVGGMSAEANGGNFWRGAAQAGSVAAFNHWEHGPRKKKLSPGNKGGIIGDNLYNDRYTGKNNPKGYKLFPLNERDAISMQHDKDYDLIGAVGEHGAWSDGLAIPADARFAKNQFILGGRYLGEGLKARYPINILLYRESLRTFGASIGIGALAVKKYYFNSNPFYR